MKKNLFYFLAMSASLFVSCSSDTVEGIEKPNGVLPKVVKYTDHYGSSEFKINYNGNKIVSKVGSNERTDYTYTGNFITKEINYSIVAGKNIKKFEYSYTYSGGKLAIVNFAKNFSTQFPEGELKERNVYTYNADGSVNVNSYYIDFSLAETSTERELETSELTFNGGNLVKKISTISMGSGVSYIETPVAEYNYTYDTNNNPFENILGFNLLMKEFVNNVTQTKTSSVLPNGSYLNTKLKNTEYTYNKQGYPVKAFNNMLTIEYIY